MSGIFGGGSKAPKMPDPIDPGKSMGEYLFGRGFTGYQGITDPRLQERLIGAERTYRPQYTALELADIGVMARGIEAGAANPEYARLQAELAGLRAGQEYASLNSAERSSALEKKAMELYPNSQQSRRARWPGGNQQTNKQQAAKRESFIEAIEGSSIGDRAAKIAQLETQLEGMSPTLEGTPGLFDLLEEQSTRAGVLQREQLGLQRADDVSALEEFAPQVVEAYRTADPYSTGLAESQTAMAQDLYQRSQGLNPEQQRLADQAALQMSQRAGRIGDQSSIASQVLGREQYLSGLRAEAAGMGQQAFNQNRLLAGDIGNTLLGRSSASIGLGQSVLGAAQRGAEGQMGPQLFDPNVGLNMAMQQQTNEVNYGGAMAQASASKSAGMMGAVGSVAGAGITAMAI